MARPPNGLTALLRGEPEQMIAALIEHRCLNSAGLADREAVVDLVRKAIQAQEEFYARHEGFTGPSPVDCAADALKDSFYLSRRGRKLYDSF
jgi:hypothetical protein